MFTFLIFQDHCKLGHILSVWEIISVELAKQMTLHEEVRVNLFPITIFANYMIE